MEPVNFFGMLTSLISNVMTNHALDKNNVSFIIACVVTIAIIALGVFLAWRQFKRELWKKYEYNRSEHVGQTRFDHELNCLEELSSALYEFINASNKETWENARVRVSNALAKAGPVLSRTKITLLFHEGFGITARETIKFYDEVTDFLSRYETYSQLATNHEAAKVAYGRFIRAAHCKLSAAEHGCQDAKKYLTGEQTLMLKEAEIKFEDVWPCKFVKEEEMHLFGL